MKIYNQLSENYNKLFKKGIEEFYKKCKNSKLANKDYCSFYPSFGIQKNEQAEFLIVGQAVNGWESGFNTGDKPIQSKKITSESMEASNCYCVEHNHTPLDWVNVKWSKSVYEEQIIDKIKKKFYDEGNKYFTYRSFFWNVVYKLINDFYDTGDKSWEWTNKIVWTNLYKIAPDGTNPNEQEKIFQQPNALELLKTEIEEINPKYCIVLSNLEWWEPFRDQLDTQKLKVPDYLTEIVSYETFNNTQIIVTNRPFPNGPSDEYVRQILELIK